MRLNSSRIESNDDFEDDASATGILVDNTTFRRRLRRQCRCRCSCVKDDDNDGDIISGNDDNLRGGGDANAKSMAASAFVILANNFVTNRSRTSWCWWRLCRFPRGFIVNILHSAIIIWWCDGRNKMQNQLQLMTILLPVLIHSHIHFGRDSTDGCSEADDHCRVDGGMEREDLERV